MTPKQEKLIENYVRAKVRRMISKKPLKENRIEDVVNETDLKRFKDLMRMLVADWRNDGFDDTDILRYLNKLLQQI